jgi:hypothetical protein
VPDKDRNLPETELAAKKLAKSDLGRPQGCYANDASVGVEVLSPASAGAPAFASTGSEVWDSTPPASATGSSSRYLCFAARLQAQIATNTVPAFNYMVLPNDHTVGTMPGKPTPQSMVADNDEATGLVIDALSHSRYWASSIVFVVEDDPSDGGDHVDGHRSIFLAISPWVKKEYVSKTHLSLASIFKTVNLILGLPPLNQYDAAATDLRDLFTSRPDFAPYNFQQVQYARRASPVWLALTKDVDFSRPDADEAKLFAAIMKSEGLPRQTPPLQK